MCIRYLGFVLLIWCPGELHAQSATQSCSAPTLDGGKFSPKRETYANGVYVTYSCDLGRKPAVEGWWARSTCQNGTWSPQPQCILEEACIPPEIPNAKYTESPTGWYEDGQKIRITCDEAYELKNRDATALCTNGSWSSVPVCERSVDACGEPPKVLHAVIVDHKYQELFAADTELQYECVNGYTAEGAGSDKTIVCIAGAWTEGPTCTSVDRCGTPPKIQHAEVVRTLRTSVRYQCNDYYKRHGPESVRCYSDGTWSELPTCEASFCVVNTLEYPDLKPAGVKYIEDGDDVRLECADKWMFNNYSDGQCNNRIIHLSRCCTKAQLYLNTCDGFLTKEN